MRGSEGANLSVFLVQIVRGQSGSNVAGKVLLVFFRFLLLEMGHVVGHVFPEDLIPMHFRVVFI